MSVVAVVASDLTVLDDEIALVVQFTEWVLARNPAADALREQVRQRWGEAGLVSLAMAISASRVYPSMKYVLGHGHVCSRVQIAQQRIAPGLLRCAAPTDRALGAMEL